MWLRKSRELYFLFKLKLNVHGADLRKVISDHNGFDVSRMLSCSYERHADGQDMTLSGQANRMRDSVAKSFDETYAMLKKYDRLVKEYDRVTTDEAEDLGCDAHNRQELEVEAGRQARAETGPESHVRLGCCVR